ncbi:MAG: hypothetical protein ACLU9Q_19260 [Marvinbryantia sp.]|uniref:hypothetical protein n=1 Tax=Marvinbryantia sp. TaxID=2496532 RepID=UPI0025D6689E|nr:hypothetical protein [uncultured Marvinbryantia sp.]
MKHAKKFMMLLLTGVMAISTVSIPAAAENSSLNLYEDYDCSFPVGVDEESLVSLDTNVIESQGLFAKSISKTVKKFYTDKNSVPAALNYREYIDGAWYGGNLSLIEVVYKQGSNLYEATFSGKLYLQ